MKLSIFARNTVIALAALLGLLLSPSVQAQTVTGGLRGAVTDGTGAIVPGATVTAVNTATGIATKTTATDEGFYAIPRMLPGRYSVSAEAAGFKKFEQTEVEVSVGKDAVIDFKLEPGAITEVVTVTGGAQALVEKDTVQISTTFSERKVQELPVNIPGRGIDRIALLTPGVTLGFGNVNGNGVTLSANGQRARSNNFAMDGVDNNDLTLGGPSFFVRNPDVVSEFQVITNNFSAEFGRNQGAVVNISTRSGGNAYHGSVNWDHLDAKNFNSLTNLQRRSGRKDPPANLDNLFSYALGGPIVKQKAFFFTSGWFRRNPATVLIQPVLLAPTPAGLQALKAAYPNNGGVQFLADYLAFALPFGNPRIRPDVTPSTITIGNTVVPVASPERSVVQPTTINEYTGRGDVTPNDKHRFWGRYFWQKNEGKDGLAAQTGVTGDNPQLSKQIGGGWNWTLSTRLTNEFRVNYSRLFVLFGGGSSGGDKGQIPSIYEIDKAVTWIALNFTAANGAGLLAVGPAQNLPQGRDVKAWQFSDNLSWLRGNHQLKMGADFRKLLNYAPFLPNVNGAFTYNTPAELVANTPGNFQVAFGPTDLDYKEFDQYYYFQDDWRLRPNLTLNLGVRYEYTGQPINQLADLTVARESDPARALWRQTLPIEARTLPRVPVDKNNWAPRLGFVYSPRTSGGWLNRLFGSDKTTLRGGYGIAYDPAFYNLLLNISTSSPIALTTGAPGFGLPLGATTGDKVRDAAARSGLIRFNTFDPRLLNRTTANANFAAPYSQQWSFGLQREFGSGQVLEARYVGTHAVSLFQTVNANPFVGNLVNGFSRNYFDPTANATRALAFPGFKSLLPNVTPLTCTDNPATPDNEAACNGRLFNGGPQRERLNGAQSLYHGLQTRFDGRFRKDWIYGLTYTWSHAIDNSSEVFNFAGGNTVAVAQNPLDLTRGERGNSGFDVRHSFTANFIWNLPFMKEQKGVLGRLAGGWQVNGIARVQGGRLFNPLQANSARNPYEDTGFMNAFFGVSHLRPFSGNPQATSNLVAITDVDACLFYGRCGTSGGAPILRTSPTGFCLLNDLNKATPVFTSVTPNDVRFIVNGAGAAMKFGTPFGNIGRNT
ncbi:MAG: TonB-dependent receptor, partial [Acidobacteria bacterium]|nr:TonB-dependent receptor [Acidobacteriota bacterium]